MTPERLAEIKARCEAVIEGVPKTNLLCKKCILLNSALPDCIAEIERLRDILRSSAARFTSMGRTHAAIDEVLEQK